MRYILILFLSFGFNLCYAQLDTLHVKFSSEKPSYFIAIGKHNNDPVKKSSFPFDGGRHYYLKETLIFAFNSYTPKWMDHQFYYEKVPLDRLDQKAFKDREWFDKTDYDSIIDYFDSKDKVIMLYDTTQPVKNDSVYLVRVYFNYPAEE